ncbi:MAG: hypothetical protein KatS3mg008_1708 [Acidimicrobiales bacterium]|nr:MAG: hypothetical protein KatS3mg008_1708 [Acidimicrobiales bacterium]
MRTTINLDDDLASYLKKLARRDGKSVSRIVNDLVRAALGATRGAGSEEEYRPTVLHTGRPKIDVTDVATALERLESGGTS